MEPQPTPPTAPKSERPPPWHHLAFKNPGEHRAFMATRRCFLERAVGWEHRPAEFLGNFIEEGWCKGEITGISCPGGIGDWASVAVLHYEESWPEVFGLLIDAGHRPKAGMSVKFSWGSGGGTIVGGGMSVTWSHRTPTDTSDEFEVEIGTPFRYRHVFVEAEGSPSDALLRLRANPDSLKRESLAMQRAILKAREKEIDSGVLRKRVIVGTGRNRRGEKVPYTPAEEQELLDTARATFAAEKAFIDKHYREMHSSLTKLMPDTCFLPPPE
jgi:hypothetical protein